MHEVGTGEIVQQSTKLAPLDAIYILQGWSADRIFILLIVSRPCLRASSERCHERVSEAFLTDEYVGSTRNSGRSIFQESVGSHS